MKVPRIVIPSLALKSPSACNPLIRHINDLAHSAELRINKQGKNEKKTKSAPFSFHH